MTTAPTSARSSAHTTSRMGTWMSGRTERRPAGSAQPDRRPRLASVQGQARLAGPHELQNPSHDNDDKPGRWTKRPLPTTAPSSYGPPAPPLLPPPPPPPPPPLP